MSAPAPGSKEAVKAGFNMFGGNLRAVFNHAGITNHMEETTLESDLDTMVSQAGRPFQLLPECTSWILHYDVDPNEFTLIKYEFASPYIRKAVWAKCVAHCAARVCVMMLIAETFYHDDSLWGDLASQMFDDIEMIQRGGSFLVQQINLDFSKSSVSGTGTPHTYLSLPSRQVHDISTLYNDEHVYPVKSHLTTADGVIQPVLFQPTMGKKHSVNIEDLIKTATELRSGTENIRIYLVTPPCALRNCFSDSFTHSNMTNIPEYIEYWVLQAYEPCFE